MTLSTKESLEKRNGRMKNQLTLDDLEGLKLVEASNVGSLEQAQLVLEHAYMQGSQGWGVTEGVASTLFLATELREALDVAQTADENHRMLKGVQMENGRLKKKIENLEQAQTGAEATILAQDLRIKELEDLLEKSINAEKAAAAIIKKEIDNREEA